MLSIDSRNYQIRDEMPTLIIIKSETIQAKILYNIHDSV